MAKRKTPLMKKHGAMVVALAQAPPKYRSKLIKEAPKHVIQCISECCSNLLKCNVPLSVSQKQRLHPKRQHLRDLASKSVPISKKKKILNQTGGLLPFLIPLIGKAIVGGALGALAR